MNQSISTKTFNLRPAAESDIDRCWEMLQQGKAQMFREGKKQWTETYPSRQSVENDLARGVAHVLELDGSVVAYGAVIFDGEPAYAQIEDRWLSHGSYVVIHRLAVADEVKRQGVATEFFRQVMRLATTRGVHSIKVDTNYDNFYMQHLLARLDFTYCGDVSYPQGARMAYEKVF